MIAEDAGSVFTGGKAAVASFTGGTIGVITGYGIFNGSSDAVLFNDSTDSLPNLERTDDVGMDLEETGQIIGNGRYLDPATLKNMDEVTKVPYWHLPEGYHMSKTTTTVGGQEGDYHFLTKDNTVVYDGNGHAPIEGVSIDNVERLDDRFYAASKKNPATVMDNEFFNEDGYHFTGWNTEPDWSGDSYAPGDEVEVPAGEEVVLYAVWTYPVTITANSAEKVYDSKPLTEGGFTNTALPEGDDHTFEVVMTPESTITDVGTQPNVVGTVDGVTVSGEAPTVVGKYYVTIADGTLTVNHKTVTITGKDATKTYDGTPLTEPGFIADPLEEGDEHEFTVVMTDDSTVTYADKPVPNVIATVDGVAVEPGKETVVGNYLITTKDGTLTIEEADVPAKSEDPNKGTVTPESVKVGKEGAKPVVKAEPKPGYHFVNWTDKDGKEAGKEPELTVPNMPGEYTAHFAPNTYTATFDSKGGSKVDPVKQEYGKPITAPKDPTKEGNKFGGWYLDEACTKPYDFSKPITGDMTLYAKWTPIEYTITYNFNGGTRQGSKGPLKQKYPYGKEIVIISAPTREGYTFKHWEGSEYHPGDTYTVKGDHTFTAQWDRKATPTPTASPKSPSSGGGGASGAGGSPKTGDTSHMGIWLILLIAAAACAGAIIFISRRRNR